MGRIWEAYSERANIFLFTTASRTALGPTQPPIQWVPGALSLGVKRLGREADHSPPSSFEVKECVELYLHTPNTSSWRGAQLSTGTTLPLPHSERAIKKQPWRSPEYKTRSVLYGIEMKHVAMSYKICCYPYIHHTWRSIHNHRTVSYYTPSTWSNVVK
jgi:hypothetical protein